MESQDISLEIQRILNTETSDLIKNSLQNTGQRVEYTEIKAGIEEFKENLRLYNAEAFKLLMNYQQIIFNDLVKQILSAINDIQTQLIDERTPLDQQKRDKKEYFQIDYDREKPPDNAYYLKNLIIIRKILLESIIIYNSKRIDEKPDAEAITRIKHAESEANKVLEQMNSLYTAAQTDLSKQGVGKHYKIFEDEAGKNIKNAEKWFSRGVKLSIVIGLIILMMASIIIIFIDDNINKIELSISAALVISYLSYMLVVCFKNYFAEKHNQQLNQHRANCLGTYNTFIESSSEDIRNAVLLQTTHTIFSHQKTGYLVNESDNQNPNPFVEIIHKAGDLK